MSKSAPPAPGIHEQPPINVSADTDEISSIVRSFLFILFSRSPVLVVVLF